MHHSLAKDGRKRVQTGEVDLRDPRCPQTKSCIEGKVEISLWARCCEFVGQAGKVFRCSNGNNIEMSGMMLKLTTEHLTHQDYFKESLSDYTIPDFYLWKIESHYSLSFKLNINNLNDAIVYLPSSSFQWKFLTACQIWKNQV